MGYWHIYSGDHYLGRIWAWGYDCAVRIARHTWGMHGVYTPVRDREGR